VIGIIEHIPMAGIIVFMILSKIPGVETQATRIVMVLIGLAAAAAVYVLNRRHRASPIHKAMLTFLILAGLTFWVWPQGAGRMVAAFPASALYLVLFITAVGPPIIGRDVFTMYFARRTTPEAVWETDIFRTINAHLTAVWAVLFLCGFLSGLVPQVMNLEGAFNEILFEGVFPGILMLGIGVPANKRYPLYYQKKLGLTPTDNPSAAVEDGIESRRKGPEASRLDK